MDFSFDRPGSVKIELKNLNRINVIIGRNGAGKSRFLRALDNEMVINKNNYRVSYVTPERAGIFQRDPGIETNTSNSADWAANTRRANQASGFKAMSHFALRNAERAYLVKLEDCDARGKSFQRDCLDPISRMLSNVSISRGEVDFVFHSTNGDVVSANQLSSGESETIALASEVLSFLAAIDRTKFNVLLLDEPDVHQHPDLQARFGQYLLEQVSKLDEADREKVVICIATHSTSLVCALASSDLTAVGTKEFDSNVVTLAAPQDNLRKVGPFFGHPLSMSLSNDPMLILEGEDDERVWQQAARTSQGRIRIFPVLATSVDQQSELESFTDRMLKAIYDEPLAYSLRDGDGTQGPLSKIGCIERFRLQCYAIENTLLTTECLDKMGVATWAEFEVKTAAWISANDGHKAIPHLEALITSSDRLRHVKIKDIRHIIVAITGTKKPWEVVVGQALAGAIGTPCAPADPFGLLTFVGPDAAKQLLQAV
ncbi:MAG TPA: AAA family ATPase [Nitrospira sp.]|nr:AAA family ATPase [Nitrospira sp.]